jgi:hypothetical protein
MLAELLCSNGGIIKIPEGAKYTLEDVIAVIIYAATSTVNSAILALIGIPDEAVDVAVDFHDIGYYFNTDCLHILL